VSAARVTRYTRSADGTNLAFHVSGGGPLGLVFVHGFAIPIDLLSDDPGFVRVRKRLDTFSRTVWFDASRRPRRRAAPRPRQSPLGSFLLLVVEHGVAR
jgi:hypothetical protein